MKSEHVPGAGWRERDPRTRGVKLLGAILLSPRPTSANGGGLTGGVCHLCEANVPNLCPVFCRCSQVGLADLAESISEGAAAVAGCLCPRQSEERVALSGVVFYH